MRIRLISKLFIGIALAVLLGGIASAQQYSGKPPKGFKHMPSSGPEEKPKLSIGETFRGLVSGLQRNEDNTEVPAPEGENVGIRLPLTSETSQPEAPYLKELAEWLSVPIPENATPATMSFAIRQALSGTVRYSGEVLSDEAFEECRAAIPTTKDTAIFEAYHAFVIRIAGKRMIVLDPDL